MHLNSKLLVCVIVLPVLILLCCSFISFNQKDKNYDLAKANMLECIKITKLAYDELNELGRKDIKGDALFLEIKKISEKQLKGIGVLQKEYNKLPSSSKLNFSDSEEGKICFKQLHEEMSKFNAKATYLLKDNNIVPFDLGRTKDLTKTLKKPITLPTESKKRIEEKCKFLNYLIGDITNINALKKSELLSGLNNLRLSAINGDRIAIARINESLKGMIEIIPKDNPIEQNNLGLFYLNIGETEEAIHWFKKASEQGNLNSIKELEKLKIK